MGVTAANTIESPARSQESLRLLKNSAWSLGGWGVTTALSFVAVPITVAQLGADAYGILSLLLTVVAPLGLLDFGMGEATVKHMAESLGRADDRQAESYFRSTMLFNLVVALAGMAALIGGADWMIHAAFNIPEKLAPLAVTVLHLVGVNWAIAQISQTFIGALTARQCYRTIATGLAVSQISTQLVGISVLLAGGNLVHFVAAQTLCWSVALLGWFVAVKRNFRGFRLSPTLDLGAFQQTASMGVWQLINKVGGIFANRAQFWLLGAMLAVSAVGHYNLCYQIVTVAYLVAFKVGQVMLPAVSHLQGEGRMKEAAQHTVNAMWLSSVFGAALISVVIGFSGDILRLWIGPAVADEAASTLRILASHNAISMLFAVPNFFLLGSGRASWLAWMAIAQGIITFAVAAYLVPVFGLSGAAMGVLCGSVVHIFVLVLIWTKALREWIDAKAYFSAVIGPVALGIGAGYLVATGKTAVGFHPGWGGLVFAGTVVGLAGIFTLLGVEACHSSGRLRLEELKGLLQLIVGKLRGAARART